MVCITSGELITSFSVIPAEHKREQESILSVDFTSLPKSYYLVQRYGGSEKIKTLTQNTSSQLQGFVSLAEPIEPNLKNLIKCTYCPIITYIQAQMQI